MKYNAPQNPRRARKTTTRKFHLLTVGLLSVALLFIAASSAFMAPPLPGAIYTSNASCQGVNLNIYGDKADVYLNGGPAHPNGSGLPDGAYYVQVTETGGSLPRTSVGSGN